MLDVNQNYIIFNKSIDTAEIEVQAHENVVLAECISIFYKWLEWLNSDDCKNDLIDKFCEFVNSYSEKAITVEEIIRNKWYDELDVQSAIINIPPDCSQINFCVICVDKWHILYVTIKENKIISVVDEYVNPESGLGYDGNWAK